MAEGNSLRAIYRLLSHLKATYRIRFQWTEVEGHADKHKNWANMTRLEQLNLLCDHTAKQCLTMAVTNNVAPPSSVHFEGWACIPQSQKIQGSLCAPLPNHIFKATARDYLISKWLMTHRSFALVNWEAISNALADVSSNFRSWASKHHITGVCPNCMMEEEVPSHIARCTHTATTGIYLKGICSLVEWL
eukprot:4163657-Ditylum_brightwellii.AAC.1